MRKIFKELASHFRKDREELPDEAVEGFLRVLDSIRAQDMPCQEVFAHLDEYVERELRDHEAARWMPLLREHFDMCPDCCEQYEALLNAVEQSPEGGQPTA
jgi:hypothetical protein